MFLFKFLHCKGKGIHCPRLAFYKYVTDKYMSVLFYWLLSFYQPLKICSEDPCASTCNEQVALLWQRDRAILASFSTKLTLFAKITKLHFGATLWGIRGNISSLSESFNARKLCSRVSSRDSQFYSKNSEVACMSNLWRLSGNVCGSFLARWKARNRLPMYNWTFSLALTVEVLWTKSTLKSAFVEGAGSVRGKILGPRVTFTANIYTPLDRGMVLLQLCTF